MGEPRQTRAGRRRTAPAEALLFVAAVVSTLLYFVFGPPPSIAHAGGETIAVAESLAREGTFANPYAAVARTGPTAHLAPLYPVLRGALLRIFGRGARAAALILTVLVHGLHAVLLVRTSILVFGRAEPGFAAALLTIVLPVFRVITVWEAMYTASGLMLYCLVSSRILRGSGGTVRKAALAGIAGAPLLLLNEASLMVFGPWILFLLFREGWSAGQAFRFCAVFGAALAGACSPWTIRNYLQLGGFVPVRDVFGLALYSSNNDCALPSIEQSIQAGCRAYHPIASPKEARLVVEMGEVEYNASRLRLALAWIREHPRRFAELTGARFVQFWFPPGELAIAGITALSFPFLLVMAARRMAVAAYFSAALLLYPPVYYLVCADVRFRYPILWISLLCAGWGLDLLVERWKAARAGEVPAAG